MYAGKGDREVRHARTNMRERQGGYATGDSRYYTNRSNLRNSKSCHHSSRPDVGWKIKRSPFATREREEPAGGCGGSRDSRELKKEERGSPVVGGRVRRGASGRGQAHRHDSLTSEGRLFAVSLSLSLFASAKECARPRESRLDEGKRGGRPVASDARSILANFISSPRISGAVAAATAARRRRRRRSHTAFGVTFFFSLSLSRSNRIALPNETRDAHAWFYR